MKVKFIHDAFVTLWHYLTRFETWWFPAIRIFGRDAHHDTIYLTRFFLTPATPWGQAYLHCFHREDLDRDPHDHPFNFWTMPFGRGYYEEVFEHVSDCLHEVYVPPWKFTLRPARHRHRILRAESGDFPLWTLVWRGPNVRKWGFWIHRVTGDSVRQFVPWKSYVHFGDGANTIGEDTYCPGAGLDLAHFMPLRVNMETDELLRATASPKGEQFIDADRYRRRHAVN